MYEDIKLQVSEIIRQKAQKNNLPIPKDLKNKII